VISAVSVAQGGLRFMLTKGRLTAAVVIDVLKRLLIDATPPIVLLVRGHPKFVSQQAGSCSFTFCRLIHQGPNPDEGVWNDLTSRCTGRVTSLRQLHRKVVSHAAIAEAAAVGMQFNLTHQDVIMAEVAAAKNPLWLYSLRKGGARFFVSVDLDRSRFHEDHRSQMRRFGQEPGGAHRHR